MNPLPLSRIAQWTNGRLEGVAEGADVLIDAICTDTRGFDATDGRAALYVAIVGERFDGNDHVQAAADLGARAALVSRASSARIPQLVVKDTVHALAAIAAGLQHGRATRVAAITGSNGKTGVKQMLLSILSPLGATYANPGNRNNEIGLPLSVLEAPDDAQHAIYEMGAGKPGDIAWLTGVVRPDVALVNNVAPAHLERMHSLLGVAETKGAIYDALPADGVAVINADDAFAQFFAGRSHGRRVIRFGLEASADVTARDVRVGEQGSRFTLVTPQGEAVVELPLVGRHNVANALAAAAMAIGMADAAPQAIAAGLAAARPVQGRLVRHALPSGALLIDDSYNANPGSLAAAIDTLAGIQGEGWLVLGEMGELGADAHALHAGVGHRARQAGIARLYAMGTLGRAAVEAFGEGARNFDSHAVLIEALRGELHPQARVLVKGSRSSAMERVVAALLEGAALPQDNTGSSTGAA